MVFVHGLWVHAVSWQPWQELFDKQGFTTYAPGWPGDAETVDATRADPSGQAGVGVEQITDAYAAFLAGLDEPAIVIGHSFGGLIVEKLLDRGLPAAAVAISPAPIKGIRALPLNLLRSSLPVTSRPANRRKAVTLTEKQWAFSFGNALDRAESDELYRRLSIPGPGRPLFEASFANFTPNAATTVDPARAGRGPLLLMANGQDHTVPEVVVKAAHRLYATSPATTDLITYSDRGHSAPFDHGWRAVADDTLAWLARQSR
ncbi:alpha/beta hydrolase [Actinoplanes sp. L3-i22]|uniref:alpha/beta hydrolase n=1 Tax=Actinoplanes sp. L3-i22 TaxID=2836373 RepID=UPI0021021DFB|nr:alpha/beta hydrolase [Actinoplanes sp. L3-i22]